MRLESIVPNFKAETTKGPIQFYDWQQNSWVVLFSHPADFTPVCTTELTRMAIHAPDFTKRNTKCLAHSVDQLNSHMDWISDINSCCLDLPGEFPYPIIADPNRDMAVQFGMIDEEQKNFPALAKTVRALFIIDPTHRVRLSMFYPMSCGRNVEEILRCIDALQLTDRLKVVGTPANWTPGTAIVISSTVTDKEAKKLFPKGFYTTTVPSGKDYVRSTEDY